MKRLQALEAYEQLLSNSSSSNSKGSGSKQLQHQAGDTPAEVAAKIAADRDEVPLLDAAILIAQVREDVCMVCGQRHSSSACSSIIAHDPVQV